MKKYAVIVAAGSGTRFGAELPKQFLDLDGYPVVWWSMKAFHEEDPSTKIILVLPFDYIDFWKQLFNSFSDSQRIGHEVVGGGETRTDSVNNALSLIPDEDCMIAVHDGARPLVSKEMIREGWLCCKNDKTAVPVVPVTDSLRELFPPEGSVAVERSRFVAVQTPQIFDGRLLKAAYAQGEDSSFTDDASVVEMTGQRISLYHGETQNIKITYPGDIAIASLYLKNRNV